MGESGSGTVSGWCVEARCADDTPQEVNGVILGRNWQRLFFQRGQVGVPAGPSWNSPWLELTGRTSYAAAQTLRWWWVANLRESFKDLMVETRLVRCDITYNYSVERKGSSHIEDEKSIRWVNGLKTESEEEVAA